MNFGKLLGVGKSFFSGGQAAGYRLDKRIGLPKFNEGRNPFAAKTPGAAPEAPPVAPAVSKVEKKATPPVYSRPPKVVFQKSAKFVAPAAIQPAAKPARQGWTMRLNPFRAPEPAAQRPASTVQPELSLDAVKVMHNDLADADVEIVPVKSHTVTPATPEVPVLPPARHAWEFLGENLLKSS